MASTRFARIDEKILVLVGDELKQVDGARCVLKGKVLANSCPTGVPGGINSLYGRGTVRTGVREIVICQFVSNMSFDRGLQIVIQCQWLTSTRCKRSCGQTFVQGRPQPRRFGHGILTSSINQRQKILFVGGHVRQSDPFFQSLDGNSTRLIRNQ